MSNSNKRPTHIAYTVREYEKNGEQQSDWTRVGVAWPIKDGEGFSIQLESLPLNGRIILQKPKPKQDAQG